MSRTSIFDDGDGDFRILAIRDDGSFTFLPEVPGFISERRAKSYIKNSGEQFARMQLAVVRFCEFIAVQVQTKATVEMSFKPRKKRE